MGKITVDDTKCISCGACIGIAPDTFDFNEDGFSSVKSDEITSDAKNAAESCPTGAIKIEDNEKTQN